MDEILASIRRIISDEPSRGDAGGIDVGAGAGQNESEMGSGSVADDIARALNSSGTENQEPEIVSASQEAEDDIFQLTDDQVAGVQQPQSGMGAFTEPQGTQGSAHSAHDPINEMEQALKDPFSNNSTVMQGNGDNSGENIADNLLSPEQMGSPIQVEDLARDPSSEMDPLMAGGPDQKNPVSPVFDPPRMEMAGDSSGEQFVEPDHMDIKKSFENLKENFDPEIGSPRSEKVEEPITADTIASKSPLDDFFDIAPDVGESDIAEANELLSGISSGGIDQNATSRDESGAQMEPPPLASALEQTDGASMPKSDPLDMSSLEVGTKRPDPLLDAAGEPPIFAAEPEVENSHSGFQESSLSLDPRADMDADSGKDSVHQEDEPEMMPGDRSSAEAAMDPSSSSNSFEQGMRDMLRPMIQNWLDDNLPRLVEGAIKDELNSRMGKK